MTEDEMVGWHHQLDGHEFELTPGDSEGEGSLECCSPWGHKESDMTKQLNHKGHECSVALGTRSWVTFPPSQRPCSVQGSSPELGLTEGLG